jgi:hypothetical protein
LQLSLEELLRQASVAAAQAASGDSASPTHQMKPTPQLSSKA